MLTARRILMSQMPAGGNVSCSQGCNGRNGCNQNLFRIPIHTPTPQQLIVGPPSPEFLLDFQRLELNRAATGRAAEHRL